MGIFSPVIHVACDYKHSTTFFDEISISVIVKEYKGVKLLLEYEMKNQEGKAVCRGKSMHTNQP